MSNRQLKTDGFQRVKRVSMFCRRLRASFLSNFNRAPLSKCSDEHDDQNCHGASAAAAAAAVASSIGLPPPRSLTHSTCPLSTCFGSSGCEFKAARQVRGGGEVATTTGGGRRRRRIAGRVPLHTRASLVDPPRKRVSSLQSTGRDSTGRSRERVARACESSCRRDTAPDRCARATYRHSCRRSSSSLTTTTAAATRTRSLVVGAREHEHAERHRPPRPEPSICHRLGKVSRSRVRAPPPAATVAAIHVSRARFLEERQRLAIKRALLLVAIKRASVPQLHCALVAASHHRTTPSTRNSAGERSPPTAPIDSRRSPPFAALLLNR